VPKPALDATLFQINMNSIGNRPDVGAHITETALNKYILIISQFTDVYN